MDRLGAGCAVLAVLLLGLVVIHPGESRPLHRFLRGQTQAAARQLVFARIEARPQSYVAIKFLAPFLGAVLGWLESPVLAVVGMGVGILVPRLYVRWLIHAQAARSEADAPRLLQTLLTQLSGGATYLESLRQARMLARDHWIRSDLDTVLGRFLLNVPLDIALRDIRTRIAGRNLGLIIDTLAICCGSHMATPTARVLLTEVAATVQFNVQLQQEVRARAAGQRLQVWLIAILVPAMYLYFRLVAPELLSVLDTTTLGRYVLFPAAVLLEALGLYLSFRVVRLTP